MSLLPFRAYKESGVEWLGSIPNHWSVGRITRVVRGIKDGTHGTFARVGIGKPLLSAKNVHNGHIRVSENESLISEEDHQAITGCGFPRRGDVLLTIVGTIGRSCVYELAEPVAFQRSVCFLRLTRACDPYFLCYFVRSVYFQEELQSRSKSAAQGGVYLSDIQALFIAFPPSVTEQQQVVAFLDRETAKIDALIAEQQRLMELLQEKRQAVISHAVTKGLNPEVPMKPSGVEWLGEVPAHWNVGRLGRRVVLQRGVDITKDQQSEGDVPVVSSGGIASFHDRALVESPGVVIGRKGTAGAMYYIEQDFWPHDTTLYVKDFGGNGSVPGLVEIQVVPPYSSVDPGKDSRSTREDTTHGKSTRKVPRAPASAATAIGAPAG